MRCGRGGHGMAELEGPEFGKADFVLLDEVTMEQFLENLRLRYGLGGGEGHRWEGVRGHPGAEVGAGGSRCGRCAVRPHGITCVAAGMWGLASR